MKRHWVFALAALVVLPRLGSAQTDMEWGPRLRITPFVGVSPGFTQSGVAAVLDNGVVTRRAFDIDQDASLPLGVNAEYRLLNRFSIIAEGFWSSRGTSTFTTLDDEVVDTINGSDFLVGKVAAAMHLSELNPDMQLRRLNGAIFIGPAFIHESPKEAFAPANFPTGSINQLGINIGVNAEMPLSNNRFALQVGLEDYMMFWNDADYSPRVQSYFQQRSATVQAAAADMGTGNMFLATVGLTFRF